ncbi:hypothetical protein ACFWPX_36275 [Nocardia sp. NPDC058518]|uniref:hypothetical protein n=1 Tax=Nocardia sp. NPDC058518 TaxID=3346534 RepID=UPI003650B5A7
MSTSIPSVVGEAAAVGVWPVVLLLGAIVLVTVIALVRANRDDVPRVFESFAGSFGFRKPLQRDVAENTGAGAHDRVGTRADQGDDRQSSAEVGSTQFEDER